MDAPAIRFERLEKSYGDVRALDSIDLEVPQGEVFGFLGPNGAGKTTAIRVLLDLIRPSAGRAELLGFDAQRDAVEVRRRCGYLPGDLQLYDRMTGREFLHYVAALRGDRGSVDARYRDALIERLRLDPSRRIGALSKGNRQKVGVAQALMARPEVVVLDEPTAGLDPLVQEEVEAILGEIVAGGRTVFFSSHILAEVEEVASSVAMLRAGRIVAVVDLAEERRLAPRRITLTFDEPVPADAFGGLDGIRVVSSGDRQVIERVQNVLIEKIRDIPADDLEKVREYIREISSLEPVRTDPAAEDARAAPGRTPVPQSR